MVVRSSARAWATRSSCSRAASRSISNDHSYGYETTGMRSWRSTPAHAVAEALGALVDQLGADHLARRPAPRRRRAWPRGPRSRPAPRRRGRARPRRRTGRRGWTGRGTTRDRAAVQRGRRGRRGRGRGRTGLVDASSVTVGSATTGSSFFQKKTTLLIRWPKVLKITTMPAMPLATRPRSMLPLPGSR